MNRRSASPRASVPGFAHALAAAKHVRVGSQPCAAAYHPRRAGGLPGRSAPEIALSTLSLPRCSSRFAQVEP